MNEKDDDKNLILQEIKYFIEKKIEARKITKQLIQIKKNIIYLKQKYGKDESEEFNLAKGKLFLKKYQTRFSSKLKKEFNKLTDEEKRKLYKSGLLIIYFRLNYRKYEKLKSDKKQKTAVDNYAIERKQIQPYYWNLILNSKIDNELKEFEKNLQNNTDIEKSIRREEEMEKIDKEQMQKEIDDFIYGVEDEEEEEFYREMMDEISPDPSYMIDDDPADIEDSAEYQERGYTEDRDIFEDEENVDIDNKYSDEEENES